MQYVSYIYETSISIYASTDANVTCGIITFTFTTGSYIKMPLLPKNFFRCPPLADEELKHWITLGKSVCKDTVLNAIEAEYSPVHRVLSNPLTNQRACVCALLSSLSR
jgi:hypothetical protein